MDSVNKKIKDQLDDLEIWDDIPQLDYLVEDIDWDLYYISDIDFKTRWLDYWELFDELYQAWADEQQNLKS